jgi:hypothetical protein
LLKKRAPKTRIAKTTRNIAIRDGRTQRVAAQPFEPRPIPRRHDDAGVEIEAVPPARHVVTHPDAQLGRSFIVKYTRLFDY